MWSTSYTSSKIQVFATDKDQVLKHSTLSQKFVFSFPYNFLEDFSAEIFGQFF